MGLYKDGVLVRAASDNSRFGAFVEFNGFEGALLIFLVILNVG